ncbi:laccase domain-containing protein [Pseudomonas salmasensis]|uniref:laccase domain-containing protein n=1 Tax=Pseudomonas salmasensis TaxID=2745514 RepID=UPI0032194B5D
MPPASAPWVEPEITHSEAWFDLRKYALRHLVASGVSVEQIQVLEHCTYCCSAELGSYRRRSHLVEPKSFQYSWIRRSRDPVY